MPRLASLTIPRFQPTLHEAASTSSSQLSPLLARVTAVAVVALAGMVCYLVYRAWHGTEIPSAPQPPAVPHQPRGSRSMQEIETSQLKSAMEKKWGLKPERVQAAAKQFDIAFESIVDSSGVIQDPAGSAIGSGAPPAGGGLSGAIYSKFPQLHPIPHIPVGGALFNPNQSDPDAKRILHTHSPMLKQEMDLQQAITTISDAYANAIRLFVKEQRQHGEKHLNLCAISAAIYGGKFAMAKYGNHIAPSMSLMALTRAIDLVTVNEGLDLSPFRIRIFYHPVFSKRALRDKATEVKQALEA